MVWLEEKEVLYRVTALVPYHILFHFKMYGLSPNAEMPPVLPSAIARATWSSYMEKEDTVSSQKAAKFQLTGQNTSRGLSDCPVTLSPNFETLFPSQA